MISIANKNKHTAGSLRTNQPMKSHVTGAAEFKGHYHLGNNIISLYIYIITATYSVSKIRVFYSFVCGNGNVFICIHIIVWLH